MLVRALKSVVGNNWSIGKGGVKDIPDTDALNLIKGGLAVAVEEAKQSETRETTESKTARGRKTR